MNNYKKITIACCSCFLFACSVQPVDTTPTESTTPSTISDATETDTTNNTVKGNSALNSLLSLAEQQENSGNLQAATGALERAVRISPRYPETYLRLAELNYRQGKTAQAQSFAEKALSLNPNQALTEQAESLLQKLQ